MDIREFSREVSAIMPSIHVELVKRQPDFLLQEKMTFPQMIMLNILDARREYKMGDLSRILGVTKGAVTGLTDRLIKGGLLRRYRSKEDRRIVYVALTPKGVKRTGQLANFRLKLIASLFSNITRRERVQYLNILRKVQKNIRAKHEYRLYR
jgi:DNA-binding MarR family transcriptional regulator